MKAGDKKIVAPRRSYGSRVSGSRVSNRRVREVGSRRQKPAPVKKTRANLGPSKDERRRESRAVQTVLWLSLTACILISAGLLAYQSWAFLSGDQPDTSVPDVIGMSYKDASAKLEEVGLVLRIRTEAYSDDTEKDIIMDQLPASGAHVKIGRDVLVDVSLGSRTLRTPNIIGMDRTEAVSVLDNLGVTHNFLTPRYSDVAPTGTVINQRPPSGAPIAIGEAVEIVTSAGPLSRAVEMPRLEGLAYQDAVALINEAKLSLRRVSTTYVAGVTETIVSSQYPLPGAQVMQGSEVLLTLSAPASRESTGQKSFSVSVAVPESAGTVRVRITVQDRYETKEIYNAEHTGPTTVEQLIISYGRTTVRIYFGNNIIREETF